jgi:surfactin synthase thioesterase subunit
VDDASTPRAHLVLLPHAGGSAHNYLTWGAALPAGVSAAAVEYPGRGARMGERPAEDLEQVVTELTSVLAGVQDSLGGCPLILGGHSLGALLAHRLAGALQSEGRPAPTLFLSGAVPAHRRAALPDLSLLDDDALAARLGADGDIPPEVLQDAEARALYLPIIRRDLALAARYGWPGPTPRPVRTRAVAVGGGDDGRCPAGDLAAWADVIDGPLTVAVLPGGHFYYRRQMGAIGRLLEELVSAPQCAAATK